MSAPGLSVRGPYEPPLPYEVADNSHIVARFAEREDAEAYAAAIDRWSVDGGPLGIHPDIEGAGRSHTMRGPARVGSARHELGRAIDMVERAQDTGDHSDQVLLGCLQRANAAIIEGNLE